jgi:Uma2 family endonuclease
VVARDEDYTERDLPTAPLLAVEVLSPSSRLFDRDLKKAAYQRMGARSCWLVDPVTATLTAYELDDDGVYHQVAEVCGDEELVTSRPFRFAVRPIELLRRQRQDDPG